MKSDLILSLVLFYNLPLNRIQEATGLFGIEEKICDILGFCLEQQRVIPGMLAEATTPQIKVQLHFRSRYSYIALWIKA